MEKSHSTKQNTAMIGLLHEQPTHGAHLPELERAQVAGAPPLPGLARVEQCSKINVTHFSSSHNIQPTVT